MALTSMPVIRNVLNSGDCILNLTAGATIIAGQAVEAAATGISGEVIPGTGVTAPVGVALYGAASGDPVAIASVGCVAYVATEETIDAGDWVTVKQSGDTNTDGFVGVMDVTKDVIGLALDDIAADGIGRILIAPSPYIAAS